MNSQPLGVLKDALLLQDGKPPLAIDLDKGVLIRLNGMMYQILARYGQSQFNAILDRLRERYTWSEIHAAVIRLTELAELGLIFTNGNRPIPKPSHSTHFVVAPGFVRNRPLRSIMANTVYYSLLCNLSQQVDLSIFVPKASDDQKGEGVEELNGRYSHLKRLSYEPHFSYSAVTVLPLACDAVLMFTPLHEEDFQFLKNCQCPILLFVNDYGGKTTFNNLSPAYSCLKETDVWIRPQFWLESQLRTDFPNLQHLYLLQLGVDSDIIKTLPPKAELKQKLSQAFENDAFNATPVIGVFGFRGDGLAQMLAENDSNRLYVWITGSRKTAEQYYTFAVEDIEDADALPHMLKALDLLIFIAQGATEPYILYLASAVGTPVIVVSCDGLPNDPFFNNLHHCPGLNWRTIFESIGKTLEDERKYQSAQKRIDFDFSWDKTCSQLLDLYQKTNRRTEVPVPQEPTHIFTKYYDPAKKDLSARAISWRTLDNESLDVGFVKTMQQYHTQTEVNLILSHLGKDPSEIATLLDDYNILFQL